MIPAPPLSGVRVLDFSTLLPGPLATSMLRDAGADVVKIERPPTGDVVRSYPPLIDGTSAVHGLLNHGKRAFTADLTDLADLGRVLRLAAGAQIVVEQFRPGVADRLGIGYRRVRAVNPAVVYCSVSGYGATGTHRGRAGHDLNYLAESGLLGAVTDASGAPMLPITNLADIAGGSYPAVVNMLLALRRSEATGVGCHLDISMTHNLQVLAFTAFAQQRAGEGWPQANAQLTTGSSPRYRLYRTSDGRHLAVAALEQKFWRRFLDLIGLPPSLEQDLDDDDELEIRQIADRVAARPSTFWREVFASEEACASIVDTFDEAAAAGLTDTERSRWITVGRRDIATLPSVVTEPLRDDARTTASPVLEPLPEHVEALWESAPEPVPYDEEQSV